MPEKTGINISLLVAYGKRMGEILRISSKITVKRINLYQYGAMGTPSFI
jgi:hypothetical protein